MNALDTAQLPFGILFNSHPLPMWIYDLESLRFLAVNDAAVALYGYARDAFLQMHITDIRPDDDRVRLGQNLARPRAALESAGRWRHLRHDGQIIDVEISSHLITYGERSAVLVLVADISDRVRAEVDYRELEDRFALIFRESPAPLVINRLADGIFLDVNKSFEDLVGWTRQELVGHTSLEFDVYPSAEDRGAMVRKVQEAGFVRNFATQIRAKSGELRLILTSLHMIDLAGESCLLSVVLDVTEQHRTQEELHQHEQELAFLAEASAVMNSSLDYEQTLRTVAELIVPRIADWCAVHILDEGGSVRELAVAHADPAKVELVRDLQRRFPPDPDRQSALRRVMESGQLEIYPEISDAMLEAGACDAEHLALMRHIGFRSVVIAPLIARGCPLGVITLVSAESGRYFGPRERAMVQNLAQRAAIAVDNARLFRERTVAEEALRHLNAELERRVEARTVQLEAANVELEAFSYSVSHDLRAPLRSVDGFSKILADRYAAALDERALHYLGAIREAAQEMGELIDALLRLARLSRTEMHWTQVDLTAMARSIVDGLRQQEPDRDVQLAIADGVVARGDSQLLHAVLENLLGNAWKFSRQRSPAVVTFGVQAGGDERVYIVRDNGAGFDPRYAHKLFAPFQRLHRVSEFEGTGIGLATVQRIVHRHGGQVWAEGELDKGATIAFTLGTGVRSNG